MNGEQLLRMDGYMLLSILNMKLRDEFDSLEALCEDYDIAEYEVKDKLSEIDYEYCEGTNQFIASSED